MGTVQRAEIRPVGIEVRHCEGLAEFQAGAELEKRIWGESDVQVPLPIYVVAAETGGQVLGAFERGRLVGFTLAMPGVRRGKPYLHSHMTAVLPEYQNCGIGRRLKLFQRQDALARGIDLVEWTFDPLEVRNAHFNIVRLGAIARRYLPNCYGITESPLHTGMPTDRLVAEWWLSSPRVQARLMGQPQPTGKVAARVRMPINILELRHTDRAAALRVQTQVREEFQRWFERGYAATGFEVSPETASYFLEPV